MKILTKSAYTSSSHALVRFDTTREHTLTMLHDNDSTTLSLGLEGKTPVTRRRFMSLMRQVVVEAKARKLKKLALAIDDLTGLDGVELEREDMLRLVSENMHIANYEYTVYKRKPKKGWDTLDEVVLTGQCSAREKATLRLGEMVAEETNACRDLSNTPGGDMTPALLASRIKKSAAGTGATVRVLGKKEIEKLKMGALLGVAKGAVEQPKFIVVEYFGGKKKDAPIVLVGKGVTFDTGGLSIKPAQYMLDMHLDMSGGAAVAHAAIVAARAKLPVNVVALIPAAENAVSGESYRPGDVVRAMNGKTIDVLNTDAEGRLLLADALVYAKRYKPSLVVDVATLTGSSLYALGTKASAVMTHDDAIAHRLVAMGELGGDFLWPLPLWEEYKGMVKGKHADVANIASSKSWYGGTIEGGMFLAEFAEGYPWAHVDIAPRMTSSEGDFLADGAAGAPVRMLVRLLESK